MAVNAKPGSRRQQGPSLTVGGWGIYPGPRGAVVIYKSWDPSATWPASSGPPCGKTQLCATGERQKRSSFVCAGKRVRTVTTATAQVTTTLRSPSGVSRWLFENWAKRQHKNAFLFFTCRGKHSKRRCKRKCTQQQE